ncbi:helix-turn-helix domain-containing protein [Priestia koreensis]|uniref:helix-turn-helix domain-containing protein n=1 Tax=Priestia koreensis TaxID=284581 RepID=UPI002041B760|nr:helix-turn-helix transcriptional regulator [Priestia koreensis]MCM3006712.1 helix-turn-helix domain-containing protein [Priestia koreensis]
MHSIGDRIKEFRKSLSMNQKQFAIEIDISQGTLSDIERGIFKPSIETVISISNKFNVSTDWLLKGGWQDIQIISKELEYKVGDAFNRFFLPALGEISEELNLPVEVVYFIFGKVVSNTYNHNFQVNHYDLYHIFTNLGEEDKKEIIEIAKLKYQRQIQKGNLKTENNI